VNNVVHVQVLNTSGNLANEAGGLDRCGPWRAVAEAAAGRYRHNDVHEISGDTNIEDWHQVWVDDASESLVVVDEARGA
jgi:hypothetical protein